LITNFRLSPVHIRHFETYIVSAVVTAATTKSPFASSPSPSVSSSNVSSGCISVQAPVKDKLGRDTLHSPRVPCHSVLCFEQLVLGEASAFAACSAAASSVMKTRAPATSCSHSAASCCSIPLVLGPFLLRLEQPSPAACFAASSSSHSQPAQ